MIVPSSVYFRLRRILLFGMLLASGCWVGAAITVEEASNNDNSKVSVTLPVDFSLVGPAGSSDVLALTPTFIWEQSDLENGYILEIDSDSGFTAPLVHQPPTFGQGTTSYTIPDGILVTDQLYFWRVRAVNGFGDTLALNGPESFIARGGAWAVSFGTPNSESPTSLVPKSSGGFFIGGELGNGSGFYAINLRSDMTLESEFFLSGIFQLWGGQGIPTQDGGTVVGGRYESDVVLVKISEAGIMEWQKQFLSPSNVFLGNIIETTDGDFVFTSSFNDKLFIMRLDSSGGTIWEKEYGSLTPNERGIHLRETQDGGFIVAASAGSFGAGNTDHWVLKLSNDGTVSWQLTVGLTGSDTVYDVIETSDGGFFAVGTLDQGGFNTDAIAYKLSSSGGIQWHVVLDNALGSDIAQSAQETIDGGYIFSGETDTGVASGFELFTVKLTGAGAVSWQKSYGGSASEHKGRISSLPSGHFIIVGETRSFGAGGADTWILKLNPDGSVLLPNFGADTGYPVLTPALTTTNPTITGTNTTISVSTPNFQVLTGYPFSNEQLAP